MDIPKMHYETAIAGHPGWRDALKSVKALDEWTDGIGKRLGVNRNEAVMAWGFANDGQQVFVVGRRLGRMLDATDIRNVPHGFMQVPYNFFYVAMPESEIHLDQGERVIGCYVMGGHDAGWLRIHWWAEPGNGSVGGFMQMATIPFPDDMDFDNAISQGDADDTTQAVARRIVAMMLYLNSLSPEKHDISQADERAVIERKMAATSNKSKLRKLANKRARLSAARITWIGRSYERLTRTAAGDGEPVVYRRGHFHHYWIGSRTGADGAPRAGERLVLRWVKPIMRAPVGGPAHMYGFAAASQAT